MSEPRENVKWTLLTQSIRTKDSDNYESECFTKILCMDKYAFLLAKFYGIYQFRMNVDWNGEVKFWFVSQENDNLRTTSFKLSYEQAEKFMKMLEPDSFYVCVKTKKSRFFNLISLTSGKLAFEIWGHGTIPDVLKVQWARINEFACCAELLKLIDAWMIEPKEFDRLTVRDVTNDARLAVCLKQKAKMLDLHLFKFQSEDFPLSRTVVNDAATDCHLRIEFTCLERIDVTSLQRITSFVNTIATACHKLERIELFVSISNFGTYRTFDQFLDMITEYYTECVQLADSFRDSKFSSKVDFYTNRFFLNFKFPDDWKDQLKARLGIEEVGIELIRKRYGVQEVCLTSKHGRAQFKFSANF